MSSNSFKVKNSLVLTPKDLTTLVSPEAGDIACDINDNNKIKKYDAVTSSWSEVGSGAASLDSIFQLIGDDVSSWSKGNNATFLGGGSLAGTFATESASPLNGLQSYKYTQAAGSLNDYIASPVKSVPARFRGQTCILSFPFNYNGSTNDIEVVLYDVTNSAIIPNSMFITSSSTTSVLTSYITIPTTCSSIRVGFKVAVANSGKILNFDDVQLSQTSLYTPQPESQSSYLNSSTSFTNTTITGALTSSVNSGIFSYNSSTGVYTILKTARISAHVSMNTTAAAYTQAEIRVDNVVVAQSLSNNNSGYFSTTSYSGILSAGQTIAFLNNSATASSVQKISLSATANSDQILTAPETFSTDTASLQYASSAAYTLSTLSNAPVGTFITFTYAANTNTRTQTATAPSQSTADMNANGIQVFTRAYNAASTAGNPAAIAIQIGKGLKGKSLDLYKSAGKATAGSLNAVTISSTIEQGFYFNAYNEITGILLLDAGATFYATTTSKSFAFADLTSQTSGYLVINASKNPALTGLGLGTVAARAVQSSGQSIAASSNVTLTWDAIKTFDTNGALNTSTGIYTVAENGYYEILGQIAYASTSWGANLSALLYIYINGSVYATGGDQTSGGAVSTVLRRSIATNAFLKKGDQITLVAFHNSTVKTLATAQDSNYFSITKVSV